MRLWIGCVFVVVAFGQSVAVSAAPNRTSVSCDSISTLRENYRVIANNAVIARAESDQDKIEDWDIEEDSCISNYGADIGLGLSGLASGFLDGLKDQVCSAADAYIGGQLSSLGASINGPLDVADITVGIGESDSMVNSDLTVREVDLDRGSIIDRALDNAPEIQDGYRDYDATGGRSVDDSEYLRRGRGRSATPGAYSPTGRR